MTMDLSYDYQRGGAAQEGRRYHKLQEEKTHKPKHTLRNGPLIRQSSTRKYGKRRFPGNSKLGSGHTEVGTEHTRFGLHSH